MRDHVAECLKGRSALLALSGGVDSVVLLHLLRDLGANVVAAHVEHGIRGENSLRDCAFVEDLCARLGVPLAVAHMDVPAEARASGRGLEETARELRYAFLRQERKTRGLDCILTAHHLNDQAETVLLHLVRGASPRGLAGMREEEGDLLRPLLPFSRAEILRYAQAHDLSFVEDETNADTSLARNYVRHELIPRMEALNGRVVQAIGRLADVSRAQSDYIALQAESILRERQRGDALSDVRDLHPGIRGAVLHEYLARMGVKDAGQADVERLESLFFRGAGKRVSLCGTLFEKDAQGVRPVRPAAPAPPVALCLGENETPFGRFRLRVGEVPQNLNLGKQAQVLDADAAAPGIVVRAWRPGDRIRLLGGGTKKLSDLFTDQKVPRALRDRVPVLTCAEEIVWVAGVAASAACAIGPHSARALTIQYTTLKE
ncbi:MAG: tRNA lysidine(34) synthetase TilS [Candidatus Spyradocola sp.]